MFDKLNLNDLQDAVSSLQEQAKKIEEENSSKMFTAKSGGGMVAVSSNGKGEIVDVEIDSSLLEDKDSLQILLIAGINDALQMVRDNQKNSAMSMVNGMNPFNFGNNG